MIYVLVSILIILIAFVLLLAGGLTALSVIVAIDNWRNRRVKSLTVPPRNQMEAAAHQALGIRICGRRKGDGENA